MVWFLLSAILLRLHSDRNNTIRNHNRQQVSSGHVALSEEMKKQPGVQLQNACRCLTMRGCLWKDHTSRGSHGSGVTDSSLHRHSHCAEQCSSYCGYKSGIDICLVALCFISTVISWRRELAVERVQTILQQTEPVTWLDIYIYV